MERKEGNRGGEEGNQEGKREITMKKNIHCIGFLGANNLRCT